jgi:protein-tyrosine phosphatase
LDLVAEMPEATSFRKLANYRSLPILDATAPTLDQLRDAIDWVERQPGPVFVHCALGHGRSGTVVAACLLARGLASDAKMAVNQLRELRPGVRLNRVQWKVLKAFTEELKNDQSEPRSGVGR